MTTYYIDPSRVTAGAGDGLTDAAAFKTWVGVPVAAGNAYKQKRGTTWAGTFPSLTSGTSGNVTTVGAYANSDGSDNTALAEPIIDVGDAIMPGTLGSPKTFIKFSMVDIRCSRTSAASDTPIMWIGSDMEISDCVLSTNLTALYGENRSRVKILRNRITAATNSSSAHAMNAVVLAGTTAGMDSSQVEGNTITIGDGGTSGSHVIRIEGSSGGTHTNLSVRTNTIRTASGVMTANVYKLGIFVNSSSDAQIVGNDISLMLSGVFVNGCTGVSITDNILNDNGNFGVHVTTNTSGFKILRNQCRRNGCATGMSYYGRGIELSGNAVANSCTAHTVAFNDCSYSLNYGGPSDNATEGVGIGLDDATSFCLVYGNLLYRNEGNGIQTYGGSSAPSDTGGNIICCNYFIENATHSYKNRRSGTPYMTAGACGLSLAKTYGSRSVVANNLFVGGYGGMCEASTCTNVDKFNNVFMDQTGYAISATATTNISTNIYKSGIPKNIVNLATDGNGVPNPGLLSTGVSGDSTADPMIDAATYEAITGSPLLSIAGRRNIPWARMASNLSLN